MPGTGRVSYVLGAGGAALVALASAASAQAALPAACVLDAGAVTCTYSAIGGEQQFTVPYGVTTIHTVLVGGRGFGVNGAGARATADLPVSPGQTLYVEVGGAGGAPAVNGLGGVGGFNGGGTGGSGFAASDTNPTLGGGGGGGASDIRTCSRLAACDSPGSRQIVAAGGGGGASVISAGGNGGLPDGQDGQTVDDNSNPGHGATQSEGGAGGNAAFGAPTSGGGTGSFGQGGTGGTFSFPAVGGGGGGGGYFGGGGGTGGGDIVTPSWGGSGGGGGGSSYGPPATVYEQASVTDPGLVTISYVATGLAAVVSDVPSWGFGTVVVGTNSAAHAFTLTNTTGASLRIQRVRVTGADAADVVGFTNGCQTTLAIAGSCAISALLRPTTPGSKTAQLEITISGEPTQTIPLTGTAIASALAAMPSARDLGHVLVGRSSATRTFQLTNATDAPLSIQRIGVVGTDAPSFIVFAQSCQTTIAPGGSCTISALLRPKATGPLTAAIELVIQHQPTQQIALSGTGD